MNTIEHLRQVLAQDDTVLFIGSGISLWSGLPTWSRLIEELAEYIEKRGDKAELVRLEAQRGDLLQAASYGFDKLTKPQIGDFIRTACQYGIARPHEIHRKIISLGPCCFITTNYDNLIEESLRQWRPDQFFRPPITNRHLTETADIVHARASNFIFKPHGDASDSDSIVLTREQYRQLLPGGEKQAALESVKTLLETRPVVYIGFGLRDLDFIYVRDLLFNTYKGGTRDHYAIMADVRDDEVHYWKKNYGIHLFSYQTKEGLDGSCDHSALLLFLDELLVNPFPHTRLDLSTDRALYPPELLLALARHAGSLTRFTKSKPEFPIRVHLERQTSSARFSYQLDKFNHCPVVRFLDERVASALLLGLPGTGKSYSLRRAAASLGRKLNEACLAENFDEKSVFIPIFADLKLYDGNLLDLVERTLPNGLSLSTLNERFKLKIFLDSFNEIPREYWESAAYETDFLSFIESFENATIIIGSRTNDGLLKFGFSSYCLDEIDKDFVRGELQSRLLSIDGRFEREILELLKKPFYFQLYLNGNITLPAEPHPKNIFQSFFKSLTAAFEQRFSISFDLERMLSIVAYDALNCGEETQSLTNVLQVMRNQLQGARIEDIDQSEIANWLVSKSVFVPLMGGRVAFFHQSVTEFLAARELARRYQTCPQILHEKLSLTRWDQALFLTLSFLPQEVGATFLKSIVETDLVLALNASKYLETERDEIVAKLLQEIPGRIKGFAPFETKVEMALCYGVPVNEAHEPQLRSIMACGNTIGGVAAKLLVEIKGASVKAELLQSLLDCRDDYNYCCHGITPAIRTFINTDDLGTLVALADSLQGEVTIESDENTAVGFFSGVAELLEMIELDSIKTAFLPNFEIYPIPEVRARILINVLMGRHSSEALELAAELLMRGVNKAATTLYFIANFAKTEDNLSFTVFSVNHVNRLVSMIQGEDKEAWALEALKLICVARPDLAEIVKSRASSSNNLVKVALIYAADSNDKNSIFDALLKLAEMNNEQRQAEPIYLLKQISIDWTGREDLLVRLLRLQNTELALALIETGDAYTLGELDIGPIEWWLEWLMSEKDPMMAWWLRDRVSRLFADHVKLEVHEAFVAEFNKHGSKYREILVSSFLLTHKELTTDKFSDDAISFLLASLRNGNHYCELFLGNTATESFVNERLLPLLSRADNTLSESLHQVLRQAGSRHGRRYISI